MNVQWYPGHMTKAKRAMKEDVKLVDLVIELVDARAPLASRNPDIDSLAAGKGRVILLNKADLASEKANAAWITYFESQGFQVMKIDARAKATLKQLNALIQEACKEKIERDRRRGILNRPVRAMWWGSRTWENPPSSTALPERRLRRPEISLASQKETSGSA